VNEGFNLVEKKTCYFQDDVLLVRFYLWRYYQFKWCTYSLHDYVSPREAPNVFRLLLNEFYYALTTVEFYKYNI
jgi:hypothetical protein